jgi:hypothetical protein
MQVRKEVSPMDSWLSQDLATQLIHERFADAAAELRADELARLARQARASRQASGATSAELGQHLSRALRGFAIRLVSFLAPIGR